MSYSFFGLFLVIAVFHRPALTAFHPRPLVISEYYQKHGLRKGEPKSQGVTQGTYSCTDVKKRVSKYLQLGLALSLLEDRLHLGSLHNVALDLELTAHEQALGVSLAGHEGGEVCVGESEGDCTTVNISID